MSAESRADEDRPAAERAVYERPRVERFGTFAELTKAANGYCA